MLARVRDRRDPLANWRHYLGEEFAAMEPCLRPLPGSMPANTPIPSEGVVARSLGVDDGGHLLLPEAYGRGASRLTAADVLCLAARR